MDDKYTSIIGVKQSFLFIIPFHIFYTSPASAPLSTGLKMSSLFKIRLKLGFIIIFNRNNLIKLAPFLLLFFIDKKSNKKI